MANSLNGAIRNSGAPLTRSFTFARASDDPLQGTATFVSATYTMRLFSDSADTSSDVTLTNGSGITVDSESADASGISIEVSTTQLATLLTGATAKLIPDDAGNRKGVRVSYTLQIQQSGYTAIQGDDDTAYTGSFYLLPLEALAGR